MLDAHAIATYDHTNTDPFHARNAGPCCGNWGVCYTQPQAEHWAQWNLHRLGFQTYLPRATRWIKPPTHFVRPPLFPRYLFVQHDNPDLWRPIREAPGVTSVLTCGNRIQYVRAGAVEAVRAAEALAATQPPETTKWASGMPCSLAAGPFRGHPAVVLSVTPHEATVAVMLFGHLRNASVSLDALEPRQ